MLSCPRPNLTLRGMKLKLVKLRESLEGGIPLELAAGDMVWRPIIFQVATFFKSLPKTLWLQPFCRLVE